MFQLSSGALADPLQVNSRSDFAIRDNVSLTLGSGTLNVSLSHDRLSPSLVMRLRQRVHLLAPELQALFSDDPLGSSSRP